MRHEIGLNAHCGLQTWKEILDLETLFGGTITIATLRNAPVYQSNFQGKLVLSPARPEPSGFGLVNGAEHGFFLDLLIS